MESKYVVLSCFHGDIFVLKGLCVCYYSYILAKMYAICFNKAKMIETEKTLHFPSEALGLKKYLSF